MPIPLKPQRYHLSAIAVCRLLLALCPCLLVVSPVYAITPKPEITISSRELAYGGQVFGDTGAYEQLSGTVKMRIDPSLPANSGIVDLELAPQNPDGLVEYEVDLVILRPADARKAKPVLVYEVVNRGLKLLPSMLHGGAFGRMDRAGDAGSAFLLERGYTLVFSGWQGDVRGAGMVGARLPVATGETGDAITGRVTTEIIFDDQVTQSVTLPYPSADLDKSQVSVSIRATPDAPENVLPGAKWQFENRHTLRIERDAESSAGAIYEVSYTASNPRVMGLGFAAVRDLVSYLRRVDQNGANPLADLHPECTAGNAQTDCETSPDIFDTVVAFGVSQSGRYLRDFLWQGFNQDLEGSRVFDGVMAVVPGARKTFTNQRFAEPGRFSRQHEDHKAPGFEFPFAYSTLINPATNRTDGILLRCSSNDSCPRVMQVDSSTEFWQAGASLLATDGAGKDLPIPDTVRLYHLAGTSHIPGRVSPACEFPANPANFSPVLRSLMSGLIAWSQGSSAPPDSVWPRIHNGELVPLEKLITPDFSSLGLHWPEHINSPTPNPPSNPPSNPDDRHGWQVLLPVVDNDGISIPGIRLPRIDVPDGSYLGWNLRRKGFAAGELCDLYGSFVPFAPDASRRGEDPRPSMTERYLKNGRQKQMLEKAEALQQTGLLLPEDIEQATAN